MANADESITHRVYARIGLLGNPSDGFFGKTISVSLQNYYAQVTLVPSEGTIRFLPHPQHDCTDFSSLSSLVERIRSNGYYGGVRLLMAACKRFTEYCEQHRLELPAKQFAISYDTTIPRQAGLSGSSAIVCAAMNCLMDFYGVQDRIPVEDRPGLVLSAEQELGITAGLQDRVIQVYGGVVYMDFDEAHMRAHGRGRYAALDPALLPRLWLLSAGQASDSGGVHSDVKARWAAGDAAVAAGMAELAGLAEAGRGYLERRDYASLAAAMDRNFDLRRGMFGDAALGAGNLAMVAAARSVGAAVKFTGSGGAVVAFCPQGEEQEARLRSVCEAQGISIVPVEVAPARYVP